MIPTDSPLVAALSPYDQADVLTEMVVTYSFLPSGVAVVVDEFGSEADTVAWNVPQQTYVRDLFDYISTVVDLTFSETTPSSSVNISFAQVASFPDPFTTGVSIPYGPGISQIQIPTEFADLDDVTLIHEIGHSLGLSHPFDGPSKLPGVNTEADLGSFNLNTELATRQSYLPGAHIDYPGLDITGEPSALGALDIAALQLLYGENPTTASGDTSYGDDPTMVTIWDTGGQDRIDYSGAVDNVVIDLRAATLEVDANGGGYLSFIGREGGTVANGGYTIAFGVEIEDARGGSGDDMITGNALANLLSGNGGNDAIDGGDGLDTALYTGNQDSYTLTLSADATVLTDRRAEGEGTDTLVNIEALAFGDNTGGPFNLNTGTVGLSETQLESFIELYIAYFNRAPDAVGLNFWGNAFANGTTLEQSATFFIDQDETRATYAEDLSNEDFATAVYANVLGRVADTAGFDFWTGVLNDGSVGRDQFILGVLGGTKAAPPADASEEFLIQQLADRQFLSIKTDIGAYYSVIKGLSDVADASAAMAMFDGSASGRDTAVNAIDGYHTDALDAENGAFLMPLVGVLDDPFGGALA